LSVFNSIAVLHDTIRKILGLICVSPGILTCSVNLGLYVVYVHSTTLAKYATMTRRFQWRSVSPVAQYSVLSAVYWRDMNINDNDWTTMS